MSDDSTKKANEQTGPSQAALEEMPELDEQRFRRRPGRGHHVNRRVSPHSRHMRPHLDGEDLPAELPAGRYLVEAVDESPTLTEEEDEGLRQALDSLRAGKGRPAAQVRQRIDALLRK